MFMKAHKVEYFSFLRFVNNMYNVQKYLAKIKMHREIFMKKWSGFTILLNYFVTCDTCNTYANAQPTSDDMQVM